MRWTRAGIPRKFGRRKRRFKPQPGLGILLSFSKKETMARIGIIGLGFMGRMHYETYQKIPSAQVIMVADKDPKRAAGDLSGGWGNMQTGVSQLPMDKIRGTTDWRQLVHDSQVEVVDICVATPL